MYLYTHTERNDFAAKSSPGFPLEKKHYSHHCMQLTGQLSRLRTVSLEKRQPGQVMHDRGQQIKECL